MLIQIKHRYSGQVLFEYDVDNNTTKATLAEAIAQDANLRGANLQYANLRGANLQDANLRDANLRGANLQDANLRGANLQYANLQYANLQDANLQDANLQDANLQDANLRGANLQYANLQYANLQDANLQDANLQYANLRDADLTEQKLLIASTRIIPPIGQEIIGYKKCCNGVIVKLLIPKEAKRSHAFGRKCRAEYATVLEIDGAEIAYSQHNNNFSYKVGETVRPTEPFCDDFTQECAPGIHFFTSREEALDY